MSQWSRGRVQATNRSSAQGQVMPVNNRSCLKTIVCFQRQWVPGIWTYVRTSQRGGVRYKDDAWFAVHTSRVWGTSGSWEFHLSHLLTNSTREVSTQHYKSNKYHSWLSMHSNKKKNTHSGVTDRFRVINETDQIYSKHAILPWLDMKKA